MHDAQLSRRDLLKCGVAGAVAVAGSPFIAGPSTTNAAAQATASGDVSLVNGKFVDGRGEVGTTLTIKNAKFDASGQPVAAG